MSHFIPEPRNFEEVTILPADVKKAGLKATMKYINNLMNNHIFIMYEPEKGYPATPCMDVYKENIQSDGNLDKLRLKILVRGDFHNKKLLETPGP